MKARITPLNKCEPDKDETCSNPVSNVAEKQPDEDQIKRPGSHLTWEKPNKAELRHLNAAMVFKFIRLLLQTLTIFASLSLMIWMRGKGLPPYAEVTIVLIGMLILSIYYLEFRAPLQFGESYSPANDIKDNSDKAFIFGVCGLLLSPFFFLCANYIGIVSYILIAIMAVLTYRKEYFMLILFVCRKYTVKDGEVSWRRKYREYYHTEHSYRGWSWTSLTYTLDFEDAEERYIPVLVDYYTYCRFKTNGRAFLINYRYGDSYMFEIIKDLK